MCEILNILNYNIITKTGGINLKCLIYYLSIIYINKRNIINQNRDSCNFSFISPFFISLIKSCVYLFQILPTILLESNIKSKIAKIGIVKLLLEQLFTKSSGINLKQTWNKPETPVTLSIIF